jgi:magnesium transporter
MQLKESESSKIFSREKLKEKNCVVHEVILSKEPSLISAQMSRICEIVPLHELTIEDCRKGNQRAKLERFPEYVFFVIHHFDAELERIAELHVIIPEQSVLIVADQSPPQRYVSWTECLDLKPELEFSQLIHNILDRCVDSAEHRAACLEDAVSQAENAIVLGRFDAKPILTLKQLSLHFQRAVSGTPAVVREFMVLADLCPEQKLWFRNILDHQERLEREITLLHSEMIALFDVLWGASGLYANVQVKRLTVIATVGLPLAFWTSFFGMNFEVIPFGRSWLFAAALAAMTLSMVLVIFYLRRVGVIGSRARKSEKQFSAQFRQSRNNS